MNNEEFSYQCTLTDSTGHKFTLQMKAPPATAGTAILLDAWRILNAPCNMPPAMPNRPTKMAIDKLQKIV